jgi:hypothetical protein
VMDMGEALGWSEKAERQADNDRSLFDRSAFHKHAVNKGYH